MKTSREYRTVNADKSGKSSTIDNSRVSVTIDNLNATANRTYVPHGGVYPVLISIYCKMDIYMVKIYNKKGLFLSAGGFISIVWKICYVQLYKISPFCFV